MTSIAVRLGVCLAAMVLLAGCGESKEEELAQKLQSRIAIDYPDEPISNVKCILESDRVAVCTGTQRGESRPSIYRLTLGEGDSFIYEETR